ncbi:site-specific integrase [cf. Phormidesmis sp. LEGE 11477]|uniref:site-specific integrase n=1 Tax=cf. Phormidesmis sp. LEGE 11477 TaxID=1828680 RepID=UPI00187F0888|nr:site-specific integrase [cf. Phormidesmis sp. LEGE 11477]MBE9061868.1 tyrosine-type recombinase/integrase [cf. Phormidesmis sp. LEGE 11477]
MAEQLKRRKAAKGSVRIKNSRGWLQLVFTFNRRRRYLSLGVTDTKTARALAEMKARQIELDILSGNFDETLAKYQPQVTEPDDKAESVVEDEFTGPDLNELWEKFVEYKRPQCSPNTMYYVYGTYSNYMEQLPTYNLERAADIRDFAINTFPIESCKRFVVRLNACCKWACQSGLISENPFEGMSREIKPPKAKRKSEEGDIFPFTVAEREAIIEALRANTFCSKHSAYKHEHYAGYVEFLFLTGCRPSEAIALQWKNVSRDYGTVSFERAAITTGSGRKMRDGLKTQERRRFPCNAKLKELLNSVKPEKYTPETLVFPGFSGKVLNTASFRKTVWKPVLEGLKIEYRKPYQTRHTFITLALEHGLDAKDVAQLVGNSPEVIYQHYAGQKRELVVPEF